MTADRAATRLIEEAGRTGWEIERVDLDGKGRVSALYRSVGAEGPVFQGAHLASDGRIRTHAPQADPVLFPRGFEAVRRQLSHELRGVLQCVGYRPLKRAVFRVLPGESSRPVSFLKVSRRPLTEVRRHVCNGPVWPAHRVWTPQEELPTAPTDGHATGTGSSFSLWQGASGRVLTDCLDEHSETALRGVGRALARLRNEDPVRGDAMGARLSEEEADRWIERTQTAVGRTGRLFPELAAALHGSMTNVLRHRPDDDPGDRLCRTHGDLHDGQVFVSETGEAQFIDPDMLCLAPAEWDPANLLAHLDLHRLVRTGRDETAPPSTERALLEGLGGFQQSPVRAAWMRALCLVRLAAVHGARPKHRSWVPSLLRAAARLAAPARAALTGLLLALGPVTANAAGPEVLRSGMWIEVDGDYEAGHRLDADDLEIKASGKGRRVKVRGVLESMTADEVVVLGTLFHLTSRTQVVLADGSPGSTADLEPGMPVRLVAEPLGALEAVTIKLLEGTEAAKDPEIEGLVSHVKRREHDTTFRVAGVRVKADRDLVVVTPPNFALLLAPPFDLSASSKRRSDPDWQPPGIPIGGTRLRYGGRLNARVESGESLGPAPGSGGDWVLSRVHGRVYTRWDPSPWVQAYAELRADGLAVVSGQLDVDGTNVRLGETYIAGRLPSASSLALQVGRVDVDDDREWFYDQNLDGARLHFLHPRVFAQIGAYRVDIAPPVGASDENYLIAQAGLRAPVSPELYVVRRSDRRSEDARTWYGSLVRLRTRAFGVWAEGALVRGNYRGISVKTWAFDVGGMARMRAPFRASIYAGFASGSGDPDRGDGVDREYRDTGLADYNDNVDGVSGFYYYGELLRPEPSNLDLLTLGAGIRPVNRLSIDVVFHRYRQRVPRDRFRSLLDDAGIRPNGDSTDLGTEVDIVAAMRGAFLIDLELVWSRFAPGAAFSELSPLTRLEFTVEKRW